MTLIVCYRCQSSWEFTPPMGRKEVCEQCNWDARCCKNCKFYDRGAYRECREPGAEFVGDKEKNNFCSYFAANGEPGRGVTDAENAKKKLQDLFSDGSDSTNDSKPISSIEAEFHKFTSKK